MDHIIMLIIIAIFVSTLAQLVKTLGVKILHGLAKLIV